MKRNHKAVESGVTVDFISLLKPIKQKKSQTQKTMKITRETENYELSEGGKISFYPSFLSKEEADQLFSFLHPSNENCPLVWNQKYYQMHGRQVLSPRLVGAMKAPEYGDKFDSKFWTEGDKDTYLIDYPEEVMDVLRRIEGKTGYQLMYCWMNFYRDGNDYIGYHSDSELHVGDIIASLTLGATRRFCMRRKRENGKIVKSGPPDYEIALPHGSLFVMDYNAGNIMYKHQVPKTRVMDNYDNGTEPLLGRINLTFRVK
eukprot:TRINITY_DN6467_c0_g1_i1.p1 TRINITY_DN6467_c0_g1~~TRINITY_DN6467_c0_g1_i1.p1  ORF type:complete len:272 (-),score=51.66 TRINITY_DN6467_c0_g1_i1:14-790(-)